MSKIDSYENLIVWQKSMDLVEELYKTSELFPKEEVYGLTSQMRRAVVSIPSNIAEGSRRGTRKDFRNFLLIAYASGAELETQVKICKRLLKTKNFNYDKIEELLQEVMKMLNSMVNKLKDN